MKLNMKLMRLMNISFTIIGFILLSLVEFGFGQGIPPSNDDI